jgi:hypothetical protein
MECNEVPDPTGEVEAGDCSYADILEGSIGGGRLELGMTERLVSGDCGDDDEAGALIIKASRR